MEFSPEFKLAVDCCRRTFVGRGDNEPQLATSVDWRLLDRVAQFHRIGGLVFNALQAAAEIVPDAALDGLREYARATTVANLRAAAESRALLALFDRERIPLLFLKGQTLGTLAYANPALKSAMDIDLLIDPGDLGPAANLLQAAGYELVLPRGAGPERLHAWHRTNKESVWLGNVRQFQLDLHTRVTDNSRLIPGIDVHSPSQRVAVSGTLELPTLAAEELFAYLAVHGASSAWFRLKWIADFAGFLSGRGADDLERLFRRSQELGAGRAPGQALLLADTLFGALRELPALRYELELDRGTRLLFRAALRKLTGTLQEPTHVRFGTFTIHWTQLVLEPSLEFKLSEVRRQARKALARRT